MEDWKPLDRAGGAAVAARIVKRRTDTIVNGAGQAVVVPFLASPTAQNDKNMLTLCEDDACEKCSDVEWLASDAYSPESQVAYRSTSARAVLELDGALLRRV